MPGQSVIPRSRNLRGAGTAFIHNSLYLTRDKPYSRLARRCGLFLCSLLATTISAFCVLPASAGTLIADISPEGFSVSSEGLPEFAMDAWYATVRVEGRGVAWPPGKCPRLRMRRGSGIVVKLKNEGRMAVVATNAHIITCAYGACEIRVGFGDSSSPDGTKWSNAVHIVSRKPRKDLAFLEVEIPDGTETRAARFASPECCEAGVEPVFSIGWPDLKARKKWGVTPPPNYRAQVRRHSDGLFLLWLRGFQMRSEVGAVFDRLQVVFHNADVLPGSSGGPLTNRNGEVVGINTMIEGSVAASDKHEFCARLNPQDPGECVHVAISSRELIKEFEQFYSSRITIADCALPSERHKDQQ
jgi:S1-C subfamily serine protease